LVISTIGIGYWSYFCHKGSIMVLQLKEKIFGETGYSSDFMLSTDELALFRQVVNAQWVETITAFYPELTQLAKKLGIENYHLFSDKVNHQRLWPKNNRVLPQKIVQQIKSLPFISLLKKEFGDFTISDIYDTKQHYGKEEIYWRLVRPGITSDIGPLHKDKWFHHAFNSGYGMFPEGTVTVKLWIPIYCEPGKSGLVLASGSHLKEWEYHIEVVEGIPRPKPDEDLSTAGAKLIPTKPGNIVIFNEGILHGGAINNSNKTRVSAEITMVMANDTTHPQLSSLISAGGD
jgi:hypothetical protein